ncbi:MAG: Wadjet anti-phage system protein JetD domain-containing protein, partial [Propionibacteriaceae bacterium]
DISRRLTGTWHESLVGEAGFPHAFPLGRTAAADLRAGYSAVHGQTLQWQDWARQHSVELVYQTRVATGGTRQMVPTHASVDSVDHAAAIVGDGWPDRLARGRERLAVLANSYPSLLEANRLIRHVDSYSPVDFSLLLTVAGWYLEDPTRAVGVTPRQVPIPGVHAKWLQSHLPAVQALTGIDDLGLLPAHAQRIHFTYLDPDHRAAGGRVHDSATVGDTFMPAYLPRVVVISENKDTAIHFPALDGAISVEGVGRGGATVASFPWIRDAPVVVYWGDIDKDGYEILNGYRVDFDRDLDSILMDPTTYEAFEQYGTNLDQYGREILPGAPRIVDRLSQVERDVYLMLVNSQHTGHRRVEQERIPLVRALGAVRLLL